MSDDQKDLEERKKLNKRQERLAGIIGVMLMISLAVIFFARAHGCSFEPKKEVVYQTVPPTEPGTGTPTDTGTNTGTGTATSCDDGAAPGTVKDGACPNGEEGRVVLVCASDGTYKEAVHDCRVVPGPDCTAQDTSFAAVQPIMTRNCTGSCHRGKDEYVNAKTNATDYIRRVKLPLADPQHMPRGSTMTESEVATFEDWIRDGYCPAPAPGDDDDYGFQSFDASETAALAFATDPEKVRADDRLTTRFLSATDIIDAGGSKDDVAAYKQAAEKALNSLSSERDLGRLVDVAPGLWKLNLIDYGLTAADWTAIEAADLVDIVSETNRGKLLQLITATEKPVLHVASFIDASLRNGPTYRKLLRIPNTFPELAVLIGADFAGDQQRREIVMSTFVGSPLSPHNRMVAVVKTRDGSLWCTFDTGPIDTPEKNFFNFPNLPDVGGVLNAQFVAGECIWTLPNGMHGYALFNAKQTFAPPTGTPQIVKFIRSDLDLVQDVAPVNVVRDFLSPWTSEIQNGISCFRCHAPGMLPLTDQIRANVVANGAQFGTDKDLLLAVYKDKVRMDGELDRENAHYNATLNRLAVTGRVAGTEPVTIVSDAQLLPWNQAKVCGKLAIRDSDCPVLLNQSATAQAQWGQLKNGGSIPFEQFVASAQTVITELRLFKDPF